MSLDPTYGVPVSDVKLETISRDLFECDFASPVWDPDTGLFTTPSGHVGTFSRGATLASVADVNGDTYTALEAQPAWEQRDWDNDGVVREAFGLRMGANDRFALPGSLVPMAMHGLLEIIETGIRTTANATLFAYRKDDGTGDGFYLDTSGTYYRFNYTSGGTTRTATLTSGQPASGDRVRFYWDLTQPGVLTFYQSINGAAATNAAAAALALPAAWATGCAFRFNSRGLTQNPASAWYRRCRLRAGALDLTTLIERR